MNEVTIIKANNNPKKILLGINFFFNRYPPAFFYAQPLAIRALSSFQLYLQESGLNLICGRKSSKMPPSSSIYNPAA
jgi:hypothetical protein